VNGSELKVYDSAIVEGNGAVGKVVSIDDNGVTVQGTGGRILIKRVRPAGGGKIPASEWAAGAEVSVGEKLGSNL
jgi:methionyl-tRNA formyltransferase